MINQEDEEHTTGTPVIPLVDAVAAPPQMLCILHLLAC